MSGKVALARQGRYREAERFGLRRTSVDVPGRLCFRAHGLQVIPSTWVTLSGNPSERTVSVPRAYR